MGGCGPAPHLSTLVATWSLAPSLLHSGPALTSCLNHSAPLPASAPGSGWGGCNRGLLTGSLCCDEVLKHDSPGLRGIRRAACSCRQRSRLQTEGVSREKVCLLGGV